MFCLHAMSSLSDIIDDYGIQMHCYADDTQKLASFTPGKNEQEVLNNLEQCIDGVRKWMANNFLKLNDDKSEFIVLGTKSNLKTSQQIKMCIASLIKV